MGNKTTPSEAVAAIIAAINAQDTTAIRKFLAPDVLMEYPYSPPGFVLSVQGIDQVVECLNRVLAGFTRFTLHVSHEYSGPDAVLVEARSEAERPDGTLYANQYVLVLEFVDDLVQAWREYFDPGKLQDASGIRLP